MYRFEKGYFAISKTGHDNNQLYIIISSDDEYVYLSDGRIKTIEKPKRKNKKHIQIIETMDQNINDIIKNGNQLTNEAIKRAIKLYNRSNALI